MFFLGQDHKDSRYIIPFNSVTFVYSFFLNVFLLHIILFLNCLKFQLYGLKKESGRRQCNETISHFQCHKTKHATKFLKDKKKISFVTFAI